MKHKILFLFSKNNDLSKIKQNVDKKSTNIKSVFIFVMFHKYAAPSDSRDQQKPTTARKTKDKKFQTPCSKVYIQTVKDLKFQ